MHSISQEKSYLRKNVKKNITLCSRTIRIFSLICGLDPRLGTTGINYNQKEKIRAIEQKNEKLEA